MRLLLNACFGRVVERTLLQVGHDVVFAPDRGLGDADDSRILALAHGERRICITLDDGFKSPAWPAELTIASHPGIIILRITDQKMDTYAQILLRFFKATQGQDLADTIFVLRRDGYEQRTQSGIIWVPVQLL
ncbi:MAG: DUF5615 family PIN-like protein [candidate division NC10 bacterium]|nr:DUF5615 family PIN-like protein [candidate division NC10 bacterium]